MSGTHTSPSSAGSLWARLDRALDCLSQASLHASAFLLFLMMLLMGIEIGSRTIFHVSTQIAEEYSGYLFAWMTLACFLYAQRNNRFLSIDAVRSRLPARVRAALDGITSLLAASLIAILLYSTWEGFYASWLFNTTSIQYSQTPLYLPQVIMPLGFGVLFIAFVQTAISRFLQASGHIPLQGD